jgi:ubiquinone/menaquinone biosynthesis C-methylase UbiE
MYVKHQCPKALCFGVYISDQNVAFGNDLSKLNGYNVELHYGNAMALDYPDSCFDAVVSTETLEHFLPHLRIKILKECRRVLKPGGYIILTTPNRYGLAEIAKIELGKLSFARRHIAMLRDKSKLTNFSPGGATKGDLMTDIAESRRSLRKTVKQAGFQIISHKPIIFVPELIPNKLLPLACMAERFLERIPLLKWLATTQFLKARKPERT